MIIKCPKCGYFVDSRSSKCNIESDRPDDKIKCLECGCIDTYKNFVEKLNIENGVFKKEK